ncbi:ferric iron reductase, partial [Streptomyces broussonetiae]
MVLLPFVDLDLDPALAALRPLGGFFALRTAGAAAGPARVELPTLAQTYATAPAHGRGDALASRVVVVTERLRAPEPRVAASLAQQGLAARLWSVALGCAALYGRLPDLDPGLLRWDVRASAPGDLLLTEVRPQPGEPDLASGVL